MKRFVFALDKVLDYKGQVENSLRSEYAQKMEKVKKQEKYIDSLNAEYAGCRNEFEARKKQGCTINLMVSYDGYINSLRKQIEEEKVVLAQLRADAEKKRSEMVAAKVETSSFEKLKEKKQKEYEKEEQKKEEQFIDEFVSNCSSAVRKEAAALAGNSLPG